MTPIQRYAALAVAVQHNRAHGRQVHPAWISEMQRFEAFARANFTPQQLQNATRLVEAEKLRLMEGAEAVAQERTAANAYSSVARTVSEMTHGMFGQPHATPEQVRAAAQGKKVPRFERKQATQAERDAAFRQRTRHIDPQGRGWTEAEWEKRMDTLADASPEQFRRLAGSYRADPHELQRSARKWKHERIEHGLQKRAQERDRVRGVSTAETLEPNDRDRRRAALVTAFMDHSADAIETDARDGRVSETSRFINEDISDDLLNETDGDGRLSRRAHLARNWSEAEE